MDVIESLAGMVSSMLEFPLVGFLGRLVPAGGSEAGQQVATAVGTGLDNLGSLCSQAGLDRWELLGLAVLSAITVYRKELSSNSVYNGKGEDTQGGGSGGGGVEGGGHQSFVAATTVHLEGCQAVASAGNIQVGGSASSSGTGGGGAGGKPCKCARIAARQQQRAAALRRARASEDERKLKRLVEGRIRSLDLSVNHLQQLRASVDASWSSFSTAWEARRSRGSGVSSASDSAVGGGLGGGGGGGIGGSASGEQGEGRRATGDGFVPPPCSHGCSRGGTPPAAVSEGGTERKERRGLGRGWGREEPQAPPPPRPECAQCAAHSAAHLAATAILRNEDGTVGLKEEDDVWVSSPLGALPMDALNKVLSFLPPPSLLAAAQASSGAREAADGDRVWREAWAIRFGCVWESDMCRRAAIRWHLHGWDPRTSAVPQGWKNFFFEFEASWLEWVAAGQNYESSCLVGLHGRLYDLTQFMHRHPGSPETLMDNAGADATELFEDVGHSFDARGLMKSLDSVAPRSGTTALPATSQAGGTGNSSGSSSSGGGGGGSGESGGPCILSSTAQRLRKGRALARREGAAARVATAAVAAAAAADAAGAKSSRTRVPVAAAAGAATAGVAAAGAEAGGARGAGATAEAAPAQHAPQHAPEEFLCEDCEGAFEPTDLDGDGTAGRDRRRVCLHTCGTMKVFYSPVRAEWAGFYSCCRKHLRFSVAEMFML